MLTDLKLTFPSLSQINAIVLAVFAYPKTGVVAKVFLVLIILISNVEVSSLVTWLTKSSVSQEIIPLFLKPLVPSTGVNVVNWWAPLIEYPNVGATPAPLELTFKTISIS